MTQRQTFQPTSATGLADVRARYGEVPADAVDGGLILLVDPNDLRKASEIGGYWLILDAADPRVGFLHSLIDDARNPVHEDRATGVERYMANVLVATRRLDVVHLVRKEDFIDYRAKGREHDEKLARTLAAIRARASGKS
jgi:hypothetical protein